MIVKVVQETLYPKNCPHCGVNLIGRDIYELFLEKYDNHDEALEAASLYGWTKEKPLCFSRIRGVYDIEKYALIHYECPDCEKKIGILNE